MNIKYSKNIFNFKEKQNKKIKIKEDVLILLLRFAATRFVKRTNLKRFYRILNFICGSFTKVF